MSSAMKYPVNTFLYLLLLLFILSCGNDPVVTPEPEPKPEPPATIMNGTPWTRVPVQTGTDIGSKPLPDHPSILHRRVYIHIGVVSEGTWIVCAGRWDEKIAKCRMTKVADELQPGASSFSLYPPMVRARRDTGQQESAS